MINPNIASKVFQIFSQMAKTNFSITVDEDTMSKIWAQRNGALSKKLVMGSPIKKLPKLFLSEGTVRNYLSTILAKLNLRDRTQLAIWSVKQEWRDVIFQRKYRMKLKRKHLCWGVGLLVVLCVSAGFIGGNSNRPYSISAFMRVLAGMCRPVNVPMPWIVRFKIWKIPSQRPCRVWKRNSTVRLFRLALWKDCLRKDTRCLYGLWARSYLISSARRARKFKRLYGSKKDQAAFYPVAFESGVYQGQTYALPYESNPIFNVCQ